MNSVALMAASSIGPKAVSGYSFARRLAWPLLATAAVGYLAGIVLNHISAMAAAAVAPETQSLSADISVTSQAVVRGGRASELEVRVRHVNGRPVVVTLGRGFGAGSNLSRISPLPSTSRSGQDGIELEFATREESDLHVVIAAKPDAAGLIEYDLGVRVGSDLSATTPMSQYVLPW